MARCMVKKSYWDWQCKLILHSLSVIFSQIFVLWIFPLWMIDALISSWVWTIKLSTTFTHIIKFTHTHTHTQIKDTGLIVQEQEKGLRAVLCFFSSVWFVKPSEGQRRMWLIFVTIKPTKSSEVLDEGALLLACWTPLGGRTVVRGEHLCFLRVTVPSGDVWSCFPPSVKSGEESSLSDMTSFEWWTSLSPFFLPDLFRGFVQFLGGPGLEGSTMWVWPPDPTATPRFIDGLTVPDKLLVWDLDSETIEEQLEKSSLLSSLRSFPAILTGAWQPTEDVEPLKRFNHSQSERALQSHDHGLSLRRKYSKAGSMSKHCPDNSTRVLLNK